MIARIRWEVLFLDNGKISCLFLSRVEFDYKNCISCQVLGEERNENIEIYMYISSLIALNLKIEIFLHRTCRAFYKILFLGLTLCFQLNKEEEWREERKKNEKNKKKEMKERTSRKEEGAEGCVERLKMFHSIVGGAKIDFVAARFRKRPLFCPIRDFGLNYAPLQFHWSADRVGKSDNQRAGQKAGKRAIDNAISLVIGVTLSLFAVFCFILADSSSSPLDDL